MPRDFALRMTSQAYGLHGAMENKRVGAIAWISISSCMLGSRMYCGFWAPDFLALRKGPSRWSPGVFANS